MAKAVKTTEEVTTPEFVIVSGTNKPRRKKTGRPLRLTLRVFIKICQHVERGFAVTQACEAESITYSIFRLRCAENPRLEERIQQALKVRFDRRHEEALASVLKAGERSWMAHAWYLERVLPHFYALKTVVRNEGGNTEKAGYTMLSREQLLAILEAERVVEAERPRPPELADSAPADTRLAVRLESKASPWEKDTVQLKESNHEFDCPKGLITEVITESTVRPRDLSD